jgi:hypothetical protein
MGVSANLIKHTSYRKKELMTFEIELHRFILAEFNTHRTVSKNFQSSRAVPTKKMISQLFNDMAVPVYWGYNRPGMEATEEMTGFRKAVTSFSWKALAWINVVGSLWLNRVCGLHKQHANRWMEPAMYVKGICTLNKEAFSNLLVLRTAPDAQPEFKALADAMYEAYMKSVPEILGDDEWHIPLFTYQRDFEGNLEYWLNGKQYTLDEALRISVAGLAQVSYRKMDVSEEKTKAVWDRLHLENPKESRKHASPSEHQAKTCAHLEPHQRSNLNNLQTDEYYGYVQFRKFIHGEVNIDFFKKAG